MSARCDVPPELAARRARRRGDAIRAAGLFPDEAEIARRLSQDPPCWPAKAIVLERDGLPPIDPIMGGRYWPAVLAYWNRRYGVHRIEASNPDGEENLNALR
jgi:hypothetical protein